MDQGWVVFGALVAGLAGSVWYVIACAIWPFADCRKCDGRGKFLSPSGKAWRRCRRCKGSGDRIRFGRRAWTWMNKAKKAAVG